MPYTVSHHHHDLIDHVDAVAVMKRVPCDDDDIDDGYCSGVWHSIQLPWMCHDESRAFVLVVPAVARTVTEMSNAGVTFRAAYYDIVACMFFSGRILRRVVQRRHGSLLFGRDLLVTERCAQCMGTPHITWNEQHSVVFQPSGCTKWAESQPAPADEWNIITVNWDILIRSWLWMRVVLRVTVCLCVCICVFVCAFWSMNSSKHCYCVNPYRWEIVETVIIEYCFFFRWLISRTTLNMDCSLSNTEKIWIKHFSPIYVFLKHLNTL